MPSRWGRRRSAGACWCATAMIDVSDGLPADARARGGGRSGGRGRRTQRGVRGRRAAPGGGCGARADPMRVDPDRRRRPCAGGDVPGDVWSPDGWTRIGEVGRGRGRHGRRRGVRRSCRAHRLLTDPSLAEASRPGRKREPRRADGPENAWRCSAAAGRTPRRAPTAERRMPRCAPSLQNKTPRRAAGRTGPAPAEGTHVAPPGRGGSALAVCRGRRVSGREVSGRPCPP